MTNIKEMDALMVRDENGEPKEPEWPEADVIVGNPPFLGGSKMRGELGDEYVTDLWSLYEGRLPAGVDLVCYWFEKSREQIDDGEAKRAGLLATNSIRGGSNRMVLERIKQTGDIFFAESDRSWVLNGAAVRVSMVGFDNGDEKKRTLDRFPVEAIYPSLVGSVDLTVAETLRENTNLAFKGPSPGGSFDIPGEVAQEMLEMVGNPNGRPNSDVVKRVINASDVVRSDRMFWTIDFGPHMPLEEAALYEMPFEHVKRCVYPVRRTNRRRVYREKWWIYQEPRIALREALRGLSRYIVTPRVAKHRVFVWVDNDVLANDANVAIALDDDYSFGVLHSRAHELWAIRMGTSLEDRPRYTSTTTFETFLFPEPDEEQRAEISAAAKRLDDLRRNWLNPEGASEVELKKRTLTNLYNARPTWLANAHARLDAEVYAAYGWPPDVPDEEILKNLLALNLERAAGEDG